MIAKEKAANLPIKTDEQSPQMTNQNYHFLCSSVHGNFVKTGIPEVMEGYVGKGNCTKFLGMWLYTEMQLWLISI